jgi:hypothetical protein
MEVYEEGGALLSQGQLMQWGYGRISGKGGILLDALLDMWWGMERRLAFGITCGVGIWCSSWPFLFYME